MKTMYECTSCGALDSDAGNNQPAPVALSCWRCGDGRGVPAEDLVRKGKGMLPLAGEEE